MNFHELLHTMTPAQIIALINISESDIHAGFQWDWVYEALENRGLVMNFMAWCDLVKQGGNPDPITPYGHEFLAWYRSPRDVPQQTEMF